MQLTRTFLLLLSGSLLACDSAKPDAAKPEAAAKPDAAAKAPAKVEADAKARPLDRPPEPPTPAPPAVSPVVAEPAAAPDADVVLDEMKDYYGLEAVEVDGWKPSWEPDTVGIEWSKPGHVGVSMVLETKPIEKVEDVERGFMAGTTLSKQDPPTKTAKGWYTIVTTEDGKTQGFVYVRQVGKSWLVCDTLVSRSEGDDRPVVPVEQLVKICDGADLPRGG